MRSNKQRQGGEEKVKTGEMTNLSDHTSLNK